MQNFKNKAKNHFRELNNLTKKLMNGTKLTYKFFGPWRSVLILGGATYGTYKTWDLIIKRQTEPYRPLPLEGEKTAINKLEDRYQAKITLPLPALLNGFCSSFYKPYTTIFKAVTGLNGAPIPNSELLSAMYNYGITPMIVDGFKVIAEPEHYITVAQKEAEKANEYAHNQLKQLPSRILNGQISIFDVYKHVVRIRDTVHETSRQMATIQDDGGHLFQTMLQYYTTTKIFDLVGGVAGGGVTAWIYNRYLASPAQQYIGPFTRGVSVVGSIPFRTVITRQMAMEFGNLVARRSPLVVLLMLQGVGILYKTKREFEMFVNEFAQSYPEVSHSIVNRIKDKSNE